MDIDIISLFPDYFTGPFDVSIIGRALRNGLVSVKHTDIRSFARNKHNRVDDRPFGGGPGMVMMAEPVVDAVESVVKPASRVICLSPQGKTLTAEMCKELAKEEHLVLLCGHYEGIDERALQILHVEEISIGDYVLTNGCAAALILVDALLRFVPGVLGHEDAAGQDSFEEGLLDCPHYTQPRTYRGLEVPPVLLSGDHKKIADWRRKCALEKTRQVRPDLYKE
ncbi:MAG: tRNA (guanosine(37)-N1)-methyltransferase TrmD [Parachlamydiales bacterium]|jgi:tRNA (guanine37-N1)-methyltransferase